MPVNPIPEVFQTVTPMLTVPNGNDFLRFAQSALGAKLIGKIEDPRDKNKLMHATIKIGDSTIMIGEAGPQMPAQAATLYVYVPDSDAAYKKAVSAGATSIKEPADEFWGDRASGVKDKFGINWWFGTKIEEVSEEEIKRRAADVCNQQKKAS